MPYVDVSADAERMNPKNTQKPPPSQHALSLDSPPKSHYPSRAVSEPPSAFTGEASAPTVGASMGDVSLGFSQAFVSSDPTAPLMGRVFLRNPDRDSASGSHSDDEELSKLVSTADFYELDADHILSLRKSIPSSSFLRTAEVPASSKQDESDMDASRNSFVEDERAHFQLRSLVVIAIMMCSCVAAVALFAFLPMYFLCNSNNNRITEFLLNKTMYSVTSVTKNGVAMLPMFVDVIAYNYVRRQVSTTDLISIPDDPEAILLSFVGVLTRLNTSLRYLRFIYNNATYVNTIYTNISASSTVLLGAMNTTPTVSNMYVLDASVTDVNESTPTHGTYDFSTLLSYEISPYNQIVVPWNATGYSQRWLTNSLNFSGVYFNYVFPFSVDGKYLGFSEAGMPMSYLNTGLNRVMGLLRTHGRFGIVDGNNYTILMNSWGQDSVLSYYNTSSNNLVYYSLSIDDATDSIFNSASVYVKGHGGGHALLNHSDLITFKTEDNKEAILGLTHMSEDAGIDILMFAIVQKSDFMGDFATARTVVIVVTVVVFVVAAGIALLLASSLDRPLKRMIPALERASDLVLSTGDAEEKKSSCFTRLFNGEFIFEIRDLQMAFEKLGASLRELKSYVPQAMLTGENDSVDMEDSVNSLTGFRGEKLNRKKVKDRTNDFVSCTCSMVLLELRAEIPSEMYVHLMNMLSFHAKENQGCVEELGQNNVLVSFGGHHRISMSQKRAFRFAVDMYADIPVDIRDYVVVLLEYGDFAKGSCSAKDRCSYMVFGTAHMSEEIRVLWEIDCHLATTLTFKRSIEDNKNVPGDGDFPHNPNHNQQVDDLEIIPIERMRLPETNEQVILCEIVLPDKCADASDVSHDVDAWVKGFTEMLSGAYSEALSYFDRIGNRMKTRQYDRLVAICKQRIANGERCAYYYPNTDPYNFADLSEATSRLTRPASEDCVAPAGPREGADAAVDEADLVVVPAAAASTASALTKVTDGAPALPMGNASYSSNVFGFFECNVSKTSVDGSHTGMDATLPLKFKDIDGREWFRSVDKISEGAFGSVYKCMSTEGVQAAVKHLSRVSYNVNDEHLLAEMDVFLQCRNNYIIRYISCALQPNYLAIIMEYAPGGSLHAVMERYPSLDIKTIRCFMHNIISGLFFLHEKNVVHCDIKPHNMLLGVEGVCKLSDFGSCLNVDRVVQDNDQFDVRGTAVYMAPEVAKGETCTAASDIFSLGVSLLELVTGRLPWVWTKEAPADRDITDMNALYRNSVRFIQYLCKDYVAVEIPDDINASAAALARSCCETDPSKRPTASLLLSSSFLLS